MIFLIFEIDVIICTFSLIVTKESSEIFLTSFPFVWGGVVSEKSVSAYTVIDEILILSIFLTSLEVWIDLLF